MSTSNYSGKESMALNLILPDNTEEQKQNARLILADAATDADDLRTMLKMVGL